jgi:lantibiotic biosynthesis protein
MKWEALLTGSAADRGQRVAQEIAAAIEERADPGDDVSVSSGAAGLALLNAYLAVATDDSGAEERTFDWLARALNGVGGRGPSLYGGAAGVAWVAEHVSQLLGSADPDPDEAMEEALLGLLSRAPWRLDFDLVSGLVGYGVFALERLPRPRARECLERVVDRLEELAERTPEGITWHTPPELVPHEQRVQAPDGYYNLGVAHGVPGVVAVLAGAAASGVAADRAGGLAAGAVDWLLAQRLPDGAPSSLAYWLAEGVEPKPARLAWCYGDPGAAAALLAADRALGGTRWQVPALALGVASASRRREESGVEDASLCHGSAGLGHVFNRIHQTSGDASSRDSARTWFEHTLELRSDGRGFGGYASAGVLTGSAGVALALLAATTDVEPGWDRLFALSVRRAPV